MRVAFFVPSFPEVTETFIVRQVTGLLDRGHDVRIFAYRAATSGPLHPEVAHRGLAERVRIMPHRSDERFDEPITRAGGLALARCLNRTEARAMGGWRTLARAVLRLAREERHDVVHCHYGHIGARYRVAAHLWRAPLVVSFYGHDASAFPRQHGEAAFHHLFREATAVTSLSAHMDTRLRALGCNEAQLFRLPLAVDEAFFREAPAGRAAEGAPVRILTVGRLTEKKGIDDALRAVATLAPTRPPIRYDVVGDGPLRSSLESMAASLGIEPIVRFHGARDADYVRAAMRAAHVFLLPSVTGRDGDEEGTPTVILEAAAAGLPVVSTHHAGIPEIVSDGESGYLVPERDPAALAERLRLLLRDADARSTMGEKGRRHVKRHHSLPVVAEKLERLYNDAMVRAGGRSTAAART